MGILSKHKLSQALRNMRFSANRALTLYQEEGDRTKRVEEYIQHTRRWATTALKLDPDNEEALKFRDFPESLAETLDNN